MNWEVDDEAVILELPIPEQLVYYPTLKVGDVVRVQRIGPLSPEERHQKIGNVFIVSVTSTGRSYCWIHAEKLGPMPLPIMKNVPWAKHPGARKLSTEEFAQPPINQLTQRRRAISMESGGASSQ